MPKVFCIRWAGGDMVTIFYSYYCLRARFVFLTLLYDFKFVGGTSCIVGKAGLHELSITI